MPAGILAADECLLRRRSRSAARTAAHQVGGEQAYVRRDLARRADRGGRRGADLDLQRLGLADLQQRLANDPATELKVAAEEQRRIMQHRLGELLGL